jgi:hypothetical protein
MRIAVLIYGRLNKCVQHYDNIINSIGKEHNIDFFVSSDNDSQNNLTDFINTYKPILYNNDKIEYDCDLSKYSGKRGETNIHNMICHFINKFRVFKLLKNSIEKNKVEYDVIISLRVDSVFNNNFKFDINLKNNNTIYIPINNDFVNNAINDQIAYGNLSVMEKYMNIFTNIIYLLDTEKSIPHPESLTLANIKFNNIDIKRVKLLYYLDR